MQNNKRTYVSDANFILHGGDYSPEQWLDRPEILTDDKKYMQLAHTNAFSIGMFSWSTLEPKEGIYNFEWLDEIFENIHSIGGKILLATPSGARPAWLSQNYPEVLRVNEYRQKHLHGGRHNHCFTSNVYREKTQKINRMLAKRYGDHPALLMWHVSNEYGGECHCDRCQVAFRNWLRNKYNYDLKELNDAWWTPFWSHTYTDWSQIDSPSPIGENGVHGMNLDWRRFVTDQTISFYKNEIAPLREITPDTPVTTNFMADTNDLIPFQGLDYSKFAKYVDVVTWDAYPPWHNDWETTADLAMKVGFIDDLYRSLKQKPFLLLESTPSQVNWHKVNKAKRPGMHLLSSIQMLAHGSDSIMYFQWRKSRGSSEKFHGAVVDHDNSTENRVFQEVSKVGETLKKLNKIVGTNRKADVAILYDWENNWALNDAQGFGMETKCYPQTLQQHYRTFWEKNIPVDVITKENTFTDYKLLIVPMLYLVSSDTIARLKSFVAKGGTLVMTYISGIVNENDLTYLGGWQDDLQEIFGVCPKETDTLYPRDKNYVNYKNKKYEIKDYATILGLQGAEIEGNYEEDYYANTPAITSHIYKKGKAYYIGARLNEEFHEDFYDRLINDLYLNDLSIESPKEVSVQIRRDSENDYIFIMNFSERLQTVNLKQEIRDMITGELLEGEIQLEKYGVIVGVRSRQ